jgi:hypothetical protein
MTEPTVVTYEIQSRTPAQKNWETYESWKGDTVPSIESASDKALAEFRRLVKEHHFPQYFRIIMRVTQITVIEEGFSNE